MKPKLVIQVAFADWTHGGILRQPRYLGLRQDRDPKTVMREEPAHTEDVVKNGAAKLRAEEGKEQDRRRQAGRSAGAVAAGSRIRTACSSRTTASPSCSSPNTSPPSAKPRMPHYQDRPLSILRNTHGSTAVLPETFPREIERRPAHREDSECRQGSGFRGV